MDITTTTRMSRVLAVAVACLAGAEFGHLFALNLEGWSFPAFWPPIGILVAALVAAERRQWPQLVLAAAAAVLISNVALHGQPWLAASGLCLLFVVEACAAAWLLQRALDAAFTLARVTHVWALIVIASAVPVIAGLVAAGVLQFAVQETVFLDAWRAWWFGHSVGLLLGAALSFAWMQGPRAFVDEHGPWRLVETVIVLAAAITMTQMVWGEGLPPLLRVPSYILPFLLWAAFRLGPDVAATALFSVCAIGLWHTIGGVGPYAMPESSVGEWALRAQGSAVALSLSILLLASVVAERKQASQERAALLAELQQALTEIRTLRGLIPICAWCHKVRDDAGFWQGIESYLHAHTHATFSHSICPECTTDVQSEIRAEEIRTNS
jgi:integral membrane sensor domain MASE1